MSRRMKAQMFGALLVAWIACGCSAGSGKSAVQPASHSTGGIRIVPDQPFANSTLRVMLDNENRDPSTCRFEWRKNGQLLAGEYGPEIAGRFSRGDRVSVVVTIPSGPDGATREASAEVGIANSPPRITRVTVATATAPSGTELRAQVESLDPDGDSPRFEYRWYRNGQPIAEARGASLPATNISRGDRVAVEVVASDESSSSNPVRADHADFENHLPQFASTPGAPKYSDTVWHYQLAASDPDGDALSYQLVSGPPGMTMDGKGAIEWQLPAAEQRRGEYTVRLKVSDGKGGEAEQNFTLRLSQPK